MLYHGGAAHFQEEILIGLLLPPKLLGFVLGFGACAGGHQKHAVGLRLLERPLQPRAGERYAVDTDRIVARSPGLRPGAHRPTAVHSAHTSRARPANSWLRPLRTQSRGNPSSRWYSPGWTFTSGRVSANSIIRPPGAGFHGLELAALHEEIEELRMGFQPAMLHAADQFFQFPALGLESRAMEAPSMAALPVCTIATPAGWGSGRCAWRPPRPGGARTRRPGRTPRHRRTRCRNC